MTDPVLIAYGTKRVSKTGSHIWQRVGEVYPHTKGAGLTVVLDVIPRDGRIILLERDDADDKRLEREAKRYSKEMVMIGKRHD